MNNEKKNSKHGDLENELKILAFFKKENLLKGGGASRAGTDIKERYFSIISFLCLGIINNVVTCISYLN